MSLPTSGTITMAQVLAELKASNSNRPVAISLNDDDVRALAGVRSGPIWMSSLYGASSSTWGSIRGALSDLVSTPGVRSVQMTIRSDGSTSGFGDWWKPNQAGKGSGVYVKATHSGSGSVSGSLNSWILLTNGATWGISNPNRNSAVYGYLSFSFSPTASDSNITLSGSVSYEVGYSNDRS